MVKFLLYFFTFKLLIPILSIVPLWNFDDSTIDLLSESNSYNYQVYSNTVDGINMNLVKTITRNGNEITETNKIYIGNSFSQNVNWDDIDSSYHISGSVYICPKGKFHMNKLEGNDLIEIKPSDFSYDKDWDLKCYYQSGRNYMFISYLNKYNIIFSYTFYRNAWLSKTYFNSGLFDFKWTTDPINEREYPMKMIVYNEDIANGNKILLKSSLYTLEPNSENINKNDIKNKDIIDTLSYSNSYFNSNNDYFYFITYDKDPPEFKSGYYTGSENLNYNNVDGITFITNLTSPLEFYYDFVIKKINFFRNTQYVYYEINNTVKNKIYYGIIDVISNKVIFNTDEVINSLKIFKNDNSFLAITEKSVYKICALTGDNNECISSCPSGKNIYIDSQRPNFCGNKCSKYILVPIGICVDECDQNIFHTEDDYHCGFCKDINSTTPYKLLNKTGCYSNIPSGTYLYNSKYNLLKGEEITTAPSTIIEVDLCNKSADFYPANYGNKTKNIECYNKNILNPRLYFDQENKDFKPCYETCLTCNKKGDKTYHNCIECEPGYRLKPEGFPKNNCVADCPYYYFNSYNQYKCVEKLPCPNEAKLLIVNKTKCISDCKLDNKYKYQYNGKCYEECPDGTNNINNLCQDINQDSLTLTENNIDLNYSSFIEDIDNIVQSYSNEYSYTNKHVTEYKNAEYDAVIYKNKEGINDLDLDIPSVNFGNCYNKVQNKYNITEDLIVLVINKMDESNNPLTSYSFFDPKSGEKLSTEICNNDTILIVENILTLLEENTTNYDLMIDLIEQGINIFNSSDDFFSNLCYDYNLKTSKDIALKDRLKLFYPNISLCDSKCSQTSVNLEQKTANCECQFNDISTSNKDNGISKEEALLENLLGNVLNFVDSSNIAVGKCAQKGTKFFLKCYGAYIDFILLIIDIVLSVFFYSIDLKKIKIYIFNTTHNYFKLLSSSINFKYNPPLKNKEKKESLFKNNNNVSEKVKFNTKNNDKKNKIKNKLINNNKENIESLRIMTVMNKSSQSRINSKENLMYSSVKLKNANIIRTSMGTSNQNPKKEKSKKKDLEIKNIKAYFEEYFEASVEEMEYDDAIRKDKRKLLTIFVENLKDKQIICNTFILYEPLKPRSIKIILFVLNILLYFVINALFINDDYISEVYNLEEEDNFFSFIPRSVDRIFYSTLINIIIGYVVDFFFVEERKMKKLYIREKDNRNIIEEKIVSFSKTIKISYISFTIFVIIIFLVCLYYLVCFNSIYPNMQIEWIKSSIFIFFIIQIISLLQCFLQSTLRYFSFRYESEKIFKVSKLIN